MTGGAGEPTKVRVTADPKTVAGFVAFLHEHDGSALRVLRVSAPTPRRHGREVSVYAEVVMLHPAPGAVTVEGR